MYIIRKKLGIIDVGKYRNSKASLFQGFGVPKATTHGWMKQDNKL
jgi:hypothetical protein